MKKKSLIIHIVLIIVSVVVGGKIASTLVNEQGKICISKPFENNRNFFGVNRFAADVQWMLFVNYCGTINSVNAENAPIIYKKVMSIIQNNPDFEQAYEIGSLMLSVETPEKAVEILKRACDNPRLNRNWELPFLAGFIVSHHMKDKKIEGKVKKEDLAEYFFSLAAQRSSPPEPHVISSYMRAKAQKLIGKKWRGIQVTSDRQAFLCALIDTHLENTIRPEGAYASSFNITSFGKMTIIEKILSVAQSLKEEEKDNQNVTATIDKMKELVFKNSHICEQCLTPYGPGEKYCSSCGAKVEVYGTCSKCGAVKKGKYCSNCGAE